MSFLALAAVIVVAAVVVNSVPDIQRYLKIREM
jgi:hypothetical protein